MVQFLCTYLQLIFPKKFDSHISACIEWNCKKNYMLDTYCQKNHWYNLYVLNIQFCFSQNYFDSHISASVDGIAQTFIWTTCTARDDIDIISVIILHQGALQLRFFESSCDSHNQASIAWNNTKLNIRYTYYKARHSYSLYTNSSLRGAAMPL